MQAPRSIHRATKNRRHTPAWSRHFIADSAIFDDLRAQFSTLPEYWPNADWFTQCAQQRSIFFDHQHPLHFIHQRQTLSALDFEQYIAQQHRIPIRPQHWHDVFNALMWLNFPRSKSALNAIHNRYNDTGQHHRRSRQRDYATLLDEAGIIIACRGSQYQQLNRQHRWQHLFIQHRPYWWRSIRPFIIGHGLYEQCLNPYLGLTGKALYIMMPAAFFEQPANLQYHTLDRQLADVLHDQKKQQTAQLLPMPILGIPGWWDANESNGFYANQSYFRPPPASRR